MEIKFKPIGYLVTPFINPDQMPIQPCSKLAHNGYAVIDKQFEAGLEGLETFSHVLLIYHFHRQVKISLSVKPFLNQETRGVFATRAPARPNAIGLSVVRLKRIEENRIYLENLDMLDGTPLLDIKPFVPAFDLPENPTSGWLTDIQDVTGKSSDNRFV